MLRLVLIISLLMVSCSHKREFRRPERRLEPNYSNIKISPTIVSNYEKESPRSFELEDKELEQELTTYFNDLKTEEEEEFFKLGKKAVDLRIFFSWPTSSRRITSHFGYRNHPVTKKWNKHKGIDIGGKNGSAIFAAQQGKVIIEKKSKTYGNVIAIAHSRGFVTLYAHNKQNLVKKGQRVLKNQKIALMGNTGLSTGTHLHFEIRRYKKHINPYKFLNNQKKYLLTK